MTCFAMAAKMGCRRPAARVVSASSEPGVPRPRRRRNDPLRSGAHRGAMTGRIASARSLAPPSPSRALADRPRPGRDRRRRLAIALCAPVVAALLLPAAAGAAPDHERLAARARDALGRAVAYFRDEVAVQGSYGWRYSADLTYRRGEALLTPSQGWVQPPGTPAIGLALMQAYAATGDRRYLDGAAETARALAATQLESGGWYAMIEFDPEQQKAWCYRRLPADRRDRAARAENKSCDASSVDDNISQSALELLMRVDVALGGEDPLIRDAVAYGLEKVIEAQYPNGAWPVRFDKRVPTSEAWAAWRARYPETWSRTPVKIEDRLFYGTNDNLIGDLVRVFLLAHRLYGREAYLATAIRAGEFLLAAQMPEPQPGWAQQYNRDMVPMWGRKFEPPAIASWETRRAIDTLLDLQRHTGKERYLRAAGRAAAWLEASRLEDGQWARYYELETNRPLYMTSDYNLTYDDGDTPGHYGFKGYFDVPRTLARHRDLARRADGGLAATDEDPAALADALAPEVARAVAALDDQGRWLEDDMINSATFIANVDLLARYLAATNGQVLPRLALLDR
jgi:hypothetical protein